MEDIQARFKEIDRNVLKPFFNFLIQNPPISVDLESYMLKVGKPNSDSWRGIFKEYLGLAFESYINLALSTFSADAENLSDNRLTRGSTENGISFSRTSTGNIIFYDYSQLHRMRRNPGEIAEIDNLYEYSNGYTTPIIFEVSTGNIPKSNKKINLRRELIEEIYSSQSVYCEIGMREKKLGLRTKKNFRRKIMLPNTFRYDLENIATKFLE